MIRNILLSLFALTSLTVSAAQAAEVGDTIITFDAPRRVVLAEGQGRVKFLVEGTSGDSLMRRYVYEGSRTSPATLREYDLNDSLPRVIRRMQRFADRNKRKKQHWFGPAVYVGFVNTLGAPKGLDIDMASSIEAGFEPFSYRWYTRGDRSYFSVGLAFDWRNYRLTNRTRFVKNDDESITLAPYPAEATKTHSSRIKTFSVGIPFRYGFVIGKYSSVDLAAILNFTPYASALSSYEVNDSEMIEGETVTHRVNDFTKGLHQQKVSVDLMARFHWRWLGVYAKYSPCHVLNPDFGPKFSALSVGLALGF